MTLQLCTTVGRSFTNNVKRSWLRIDPCGTPISTVLQEESSHQSPLVVSSHWDSYGASAFLCLISNIDPSYRAADHDWQSQRPLAESTNTSPTRWLLSRPLLQSSTLATITSWVVWPGLKPEWAWCRILCFWGTHIFADAHASQICYYWQNKYWSVVVYWNFVSSFKDWRDIDCFPFTRNHSFFQTARLLAIAAATRFSSLLLNTAGPVALLTFRPLRILSTSSVSTHRKKTVPVLQDQLD